MEQPPLTDAPIGWLQAVVGDLYNETDEKMVPIQITSPEGVEHSFTYNLGEIRLELRRREGN